MFLRTLAAGSLAFVVAGMLVSLAARSAEAQTPATTPTATGAPNTATPSPTPTAAGAPNAATPNPTPTEPSFNFDVVKEVVVPLIGDDGRTHYVTLSQDTAGIVRIRLSLFSFQSGSYNVVIFRRGNCSTTASYGPADVIRPNFPLTLDSRSETALGLSFFNTDNISILAGPKSIHDADGTSLAVYRPGSGGSGLLAACAVLAAPLGAPGTGTGTLLGNDSVGVWSAGIGALFAGALLLLAVARGHSSN